MLVDETCPPEAALLELDVLDDWLELDEFVLEPELEVPFDLLDCPG